MYYRPAVNMMYKGCKGTKISFLFIRAAEQTSLLMNAPFYSGLGLFGIGFPFSSLFMGVVLRWNLIHPSAHGISISYFSFKPLYVKSPPHLITSHHVYTCAIVFGHIPAGHSYEKINLSPSSNPSSKNKTGPGIFRTNHFGDARLHFLQDKRIGAGAVLLKVTPKRPEKFFALPGLFVFFLRLNQSSRLLIIKFLILRTTEVSPESVFCIMNSMVMPAAGSLAK